MKSGAKRMIGDAVLGGGDAKRHLLSSVNKNIQGVLGDRQQNTSSVELQQDNEATDDVSSSPQNGHATETIRENFIPSEQP